jgi:hypothetical protein
LDAATGLYYYRSRYYLALIGGFANKDPIDSGLNLYRYANDSPANATDPMGLWTVPVRDADNSWASTCAQTGDSWASLAAKIHLDASQYSSWIQEKNLPASPIVGTTYHVPNTIAIFEQNTGGFFGNWALWNFKSNLENNLLPPLKRLKFHLVYPNINEEGFKEAWRLPGIYGFVFIGHGTLDHPGFVNVDSQGDASVGPYQVRPPYNLEFVYMMGCSTAVAAQNTTGGRQFINGQWVTDPQPFVGWDAYVSKSGHFIGFSGDVSYLTVNDFIAQKSSPPVMPPSTHSSTNDSPGNDTPGNGFYIAPGYRGLR